MKAIKKAGWGAAALIGVIVLVWIALAVTAPIGIPDGNPVEYVKGFWVPVPLDALVAAKDFDHLKENGANTISIGPCAWNHVFSVIQRPLVAHYVKYAHNKGFAVHLAVNSWGPWFDESREHPEMEDLLTREAIYWARFAETYRTEYFSPQNEPDVVLGHKEASRWSQEVLPQVRDVYNGIVILKQGSTLCDESSPEGTRVRIESMDENGEECYLRARFLDMAGYDYLMVDIFPFDDLQHPDAFAGDLRRILALARSEAESQGVDGVMIGEFAYPIDKPAYTESIMPGPIVTEEEQARLIDQYLEVALDVTDGVIYCGWSMGGYGVKGLAAEQIVWNHFRSR